MADEDKESKKQNGDSSEEGGWQYKPVDNGSPKSGSRTNLDTESDPSDANSGKSIEWSASEFVAHDKGFGWYAMLAGIAVIVTGVIYLATRDILSVAVVLIMVAIFAVSSGHKPRVVTYKVDASGLTVGNKFYSYSAYKYFSTPQHGPFTTIELVPMKHLALPVGAFLAPDSEKKVLEIISEHLPMQQGDPGAIDRLMHRVRF